MICTRGNLRADIIGAACPECGHTNYVHPGGETSFNPDITECQMCVLSVLIEEQRGEAHTEIGEITYTEGGYMNQPAGMVMRAPDGGGRVRLIAMSDGTVRWAL